MTCLKYFEMIHFRYNELSLQYVEVDLSDGGVTLLYSSTRSIRRQHL
jgi:hypothetical protein